MIKVAVTIEDGWIVAIESKGHSNYSESGTDIVCAAASSILQTAILGLKKFAKECFSYEINEKIPMMKIQLNQKNMTETVMRDVQVILETAMLGIEDLRNGFTKYIKVEVK